MPPPSNIRIPILITAAALCVALIFCLRLPRSSRLSPSVPSVGQRRTISRAAEANPPTTSAAEKRPLTAEEALGMSGKRSVAVTVKPPLEWQRERIESIAQETIGDCIQHLGNFDDQQLADSSILSVLHMHGSGEYEALMVTRLARVRRLLAEGRSAPDRVVPELRVALKSAIVGWPEAYFAFQKNIGRREATPYDHYRIQAIASTYLFAELGEHKSLPALMEMYKLHADNFPSRLRGPVAPGVSLFAMHRLIASYPVDGLNQQATDARRAYLADGENLYPLPSEQKVTESWKAPYEESDPRFIFADPHRRALEGQQAMRVIVYPARFKDGTYIASPGGRISINGERLAKRIEVFINALNAH